MIVKMALYQLKSFGAAFRAKLDRVFMDSTIDPLKTTSEFG